MNFKIKKEIINKFPNLAIGILVAKDLNNYGQNAQIDELLRTEEVVIKSSTINLENLDKIKVWREAYSTFGAKPKKYKSSIENLLQTVIDGRNLRHINKIVDIYNYISLKYQLPLGGDDLDKIEGDIILKLASGDESFVGLGTNLITNPKLGEVIYVDDKDVLCRRWNWRECDKSKMTESTKNVVLVIESLLDNKKELETALNELRIFVQKFCGGTIATTILDKHNLSTLLKKL